MEANTPSKGSSILPMKTLRKHKFDVFSWAPERGGPPPECVVQANAWFG